VADEVELAERVRGELATLLPAEDAAAVDSALGELIERGRRGEPVATPILKLLRAHPELRRRAAELADPATHRAVVPPPGARQLPLAPRYVCPNGDYEYFHINVSRAVPRCPHDGAELLPGDPG
jgi:hypothetical protein